MGSINPNNGNAQFNYTTTGQQQQNAGQGVGGCNNNADNAAVDEFQPSTAAATSSGTPTDMPQTPATSPLQQLQQMMMSLLMSLFSSLFGSTGATPGSTGTTGTSGTTSLNGASPNSNINEMREMLNNEQEYLSQSLTEDNPDNSDPGQSTTDFS